MNNTQAWELAASSLRVERYIQAFEAYKKAKAESDAAYEKMMNRMNQLTKEDAALMEKVVEMREDKPCNIT